MQFANKLERSLESRRRPPRGCRPPFPRWASLALAAALAACDGTAAKRETTPGVPNGDVPPTMMQPELPAPVENNGPCALQLTEVAVYQAVKIPLATADELNGLVPVAGRSADVVSGRDALFRAFAVATEGWSGIATARLTLSSPEGNRVFDATNDLRRNSDDLTFDSTFNFQVPGVAITPDTSWRIDVISPGSCASVPASRFPDTAALALAPRTTGVVKVKIVPIQYDSDTSGRLPDLSEAQIQRYRNLVGSMYPVTAAEITVRETVRTQLGVTGQNGWEDLLDSLRLLRQEDRAPADVHYYGIISPAASFSSYCGRACTAGIAYVSKDRQAALRVGVGVGFTGQFAAQTLAHELGHQHGRLHSPCNVDGDPAYPHKGGSVGVWGFDRAANLIINPTGFTDVMGYCSPQWVSDFTYQGLLEHLALLQSQPTAAQALRTTATWNVVMVDGKGNARWGHPITTSDEPSGTPELAHVLAEDGGEITTVAVHRTALADSETSMFWVPEVKAGWASIVVPGALPLRFDAPAATSVLY